MHTDSVQLTSWRSGLFSLWFSCTRALALRGGDAPTQSFKMSFRTPTLFLLAGTIIGLVPTVHSLTNYANDFVNPNYVLSKNFSTTTLPARDTIIQWANASIAGGPWSKSAQLPNVFALYHDGCCQALLPSRTLRHPETNMTT